MSNKIYIIYNSSFYPEDSYQEYIIGITKNKIEAYNKLINDECSKHGLYTESFIKEFDEDTFYEKDADIKKYYTLNGFIIDQDKNIFYHKDEKLINDNIKLMELYNIFKDNIKKVNILFQKDYDNKMIDYRDKKIKHPVLKTYRDELYFLSKYPYAESQIEKTENNLSSINNDIIKTINDLCIISE